MPDILNDFWGTSAPRKSNIPYNGGSLTNFLSKDYGSNFDNASSLDSFKKSMEPANYGSINIGDTDTKTDNTNSFFASPEFANALKAFEVVSGLGQTYIGYKGLGLAKKQLNLDKKIQLANLNNNIKSYNTTLGFNLRDAGLSSQYDDLKLNA